MIIVIDGPAGSGKSSTAKAVAQKMHIEYLDSGALYRAATLLFLEADEIEELFLQRLKQVHIEFCYRDQEFRVAIDGTDVTDQLRSERVSAAVSRVAAMPPVRACINELMHRAVKQGQYIAEGRDLGTVVFKNAALKLFMFADTDERARRRYNERKEAGEEVSLDTVRNGIIVRDRQDRARDKDPLQKAADAIELDTTNMCFEEQVQKICTLISQKTELSLNHNPNTNPI